MPRIERSAFEGATLGRIRSQVLSAEEVRVPVFTTDAELFHKFVNTVYDAHAEKWAAFHDEFPVEREDWERYMFSALRSRLARVNNDPGSLRATVDRPGYIRSDEVWEIPSIIAHVLNGIGIVSVDEPAFTIVPVWNAEFDEFLLSRAEWEIITHKLRIVSSDKEFMKAVFVRNLAGDRSGDPDIMNIVPVRDELGRIQRLHTKQPIDGIAAFVYLAMGFLPEMYSGYTLDTHPSVLPAKYIAAAVARQGYLELGLRSA